MKYKTQNKLPKPKIVITVDYNCAYLTAMAVLIIFPLILQTVINLRMMSIGEWEVESLVERWSNYRFHGSALGFAKVRSENWLSKGLSQKVNSPNDRVLTIYTSTVIYYYSDILLKQRHSTELPNASIQSLRTQISMHTT